MDTRLDLVITRGRAILDKIDQQVEASVLNASMQKICIPGKGMFRVPSVNVTNNISEVLNVMAKGHKFAIGWFVGSDGKYKYSLRSDEYGMDVSKLCRVFGGGGHEHAAGFVSNSLILSPSFADGSHSHKM